jgi:hypothetical protein
MATAVSHAVFEPSPVLCTSFVGKDGAMPSKYDENTKARAVRLVHEHRDDYDSEWAARVAQISSATSKSAVSRRFGAMTETALAELLTADLSGLDLVALMIDGVHFAESCCILLWASASTGQASAASGGGLDGERDVGHRGVGGSAGAGPGCDPPDAGRPRRVQRAAQGGARRARSPGHPTLPAALCRCSDYADAVGESLAGQRVLVESVGIIRRVDRRFPFHIRRGDGHGVGVGLSRERAAGVVCAGAGAGIVPAGIHDQRCFAASGLHRASGSVDARAGAGRGGFDRFGVGRLSGRAPRGQDM